MTRAAQADVCVVGAGPAGATAALLLVQRGLRVTLVEAREDFSREFRGNTLNASALEILDRAGLGDRVRSLRPVVVPRFVAREGGRETVFADFSRLAKETRHPYVLMLPQARFLGLVAEEAARYPGFDLRVGSVVTGILRDGEAVRGVRYRDGSGGAREVRAALTVGADGRFSVLRRLAGLLAKGSPQVMDVLWFDLPRETGDAEGAGEHFRCGFGGLLALADHGEVWRAGYLIPPNIYPQVKARGLPELRRRVGMLAPELAGRMDRLHWRQVKRLPVASDRLRRWHRPGLLLIGDAAHAVSPIGGVGINIAIQDAAVAAEFLAGPLRDGEPMDDRLLGRVQRRRGGAVAMVQAAQEITQRRIVDRILASEGEYELPLAVRAMLRAPVLRDVPTRLIAYGGLRRPRLGPGRATDGGRGC